MASSASTRRGRCPGARLRSRSAVAKNGECIDVVRPFVLAIGDGDPVLRVRRRRPGGVLSDQTDHVGGGGSGRDCRRPGRAGVGRGGRCEARATDRGRERRRGGRGDRRAARGTRAARWICPRTVQQRGACDPAQYGRPVELRSLDGPGRGHAPGRNGVGVDRTADAGGQIARRVDRHGQAGAGQAQLRIGRARQPATHGHGAIESRRRH